MATLGTASHGLGGERSEPDARRGVLLERSPHARAPHELRLPTRHANPTRRARVRSRERMATVRVVLGVPATLTRAPPIRGSRWCDVNWSTDLFEPTTSHWANYSTDKLLDVLHWLEHKPGAGVPLTINSIKQELTRRERLPQF